MFKATSRTAPPPQAYANAGSRVGGRRRSSDGGHRNLKYPYRLNFYTSPPALDITLEEFETFAIARLKVLTAIHSLQERSLPAAQLRELISTQIKSHLPLSSNTARNIDVDEERRADEIGHWILRLAFCRSPDLREKFVRTELELFKQRFDSDDQYERSQFLRSLNFDWTIVDETEKRMYEKQLKACMPWGAQRDNQFASESWVKVPWYNVPDLVGPRRVFVKGGNAYVPQSHQISLVLQAFRANLERALELTAKSLPRMDEDDRLMPILGHLAQSFLSNVSIESNFFGDADDDPNSAKVTADMVDALAVKHFPACQYNLWNRLKRDHHLKHFARLQFGLFLKALGLPLEEALVYWRRGFSQLTDDKFNKEYKYNIRHSYGQEGKRTNYPAKSCQQILTSNQPGPQDSHGCPYRHFAPETLQTFLSQHYSIGTGSLEMREIMDQVKKQHYHLACTRVFEITHLKDVKKGEGLGDGVSVSHPNEYFNKSWGYERGVVKPKTELMSDDMQTD
ncbi:hypothetical protein NliqN6_1290 [Naganishia liquefaciens]|uniref:DNA primase large subunit n=1 Tax=Naganishia liquefaciens TaxID=104408 RepID=A0A8H3TQ54_9TREE|nr:hypothetical protein NliqN6_1290 [Naganishia liquefaciens]